MRALTGMDPDRLAEEKARGLTLDLGFAWTTVATADGAAELATVRVLHEVDGRRQVVSHFNKTAKGRLVRALLESRADPRTPAKLIERLRDLGWVVDVEPAAPTRRGTQLDVVVTEV